MTLREQTRQNYDRMARWYDLFASSEKKFTEAGLHILDLKAGERVLEIGFGTGHSLASMAQQVGDSGLVAGVELSPGMIEVARKKIQDIDKSAVVQMMQGDGTLLPVASNSLDAVFLSFTLELFSEDEILVVLGECRRVLNGEGRLAVVSLVKKDVLACRIYEWGHARWPVLLDCRPIELRKYLEGGGFRIQAARVQAMWGLPVEITLNRPV